MVSAAKPNTTLQRMYSLFLLSTPGLICSPTNSSFLSILWIRNQYDKQLILDGIHGLDGDQVTTPTDLYQIIIDALASSPSIQHDEEVYPQLKVHLDRLAKAASFAEVVKECYEITTFLSTAYPVVVLNPSLDLASIHANHSNARLERSRSHCEVVKYNEVSLPLFCGWNVVYIYTCTFLRSNLSDLTIKLSSCSHICIRMHIYSISVCMT
jgi:hypothetical protein